ncbi:MAG: hypothetical protein CTY31_01980 [Hyphomicrobium sp.]|nr:MAG: hypothetical protein CTY39_06685 [Hyphomicrobium sp.]PPD01555.1 MAG: hypothetical protein CTY31_01980 [Hyphomicrobium sp.]
MKVRSTWFVLFCVVGRFLGRRYVTHGRRRPLLHQARNRLRILILALIVLLTAFAIALKVGEVAG